MNAVDRVVEPLILDLIEWVASRERTYDQVMEAWRTSCPRLPVWEEANSRGLVTVNTTAGLSVVTATSLGLIMLEQRKVEARQLAPRW